MSQRSMVEINHDIAEFDNPNWTRQFGTYIKSGSPADLPQGVTYFYRRHHADPCPLGDPPRGWANIEK
jgi:hypothetical protein